MIFHIQKCKVLIVTLVIVACLVMGIAETASAIPTSLNDFVIFSGGGSDVGGHNLVNGLIGSNQDLSITGPTQIYGSVYVGNDLTVGSDSAIGSDGDTLSPDLDSSTRYDSPVKYPVLMTEVVVNEEAFFRGDNNIYGNLYAKDVRLGSNTVVRDDDPSGSTGTGGNVEYTNSYTALSGAGYEGTLTKPASTKTFGTITMPTATSFTAGGTNQVVDSTTDVLTLAPGTYGALSTSEQFQTVNLSSGDYFFDAITAQGDFTLKIDLTSGDLINIYALDDVVFAQDTVLMVKGDGTGGFFVPISDAPSLAGLINWETKGMFDLGGGDASAWTTIFGGTVYSSLDGHDGVVIDQRVDWYGALYAYDTMHLADHSRFTYVAVIPVPSAVLLGSIGVGMVGWLRRRRTL